ncbi:hypothetical protein B9Z19DRAFT_1138667 [Tuber borchii]|uniref:Uncharacterized protein n=1 Tax=Tuber borchii TaxID=42251 RepID=A0A2T6Z9R4_TUBBO|nr:hypothetical protein B9Z19DRAFT_1138667 [Tuber borchii]
MALQNSWGVRHAIMKHFYEGVLCHPICPPPNGRLHTSIFYGTIESSEGGSLCQMFLVLGVYRVLTLKPDSQGVKYAIAKPIYDGVLCHPICPPPKDIPGVSGMQAWSPFMTAFYTIQAVDRQKGVTIRAFSLALQNSGGVRPVITKPFYTDVLHHQRCRPPKGRPHTSIFHGATEFSKGGILMPDFLNSGGVRHAIVQPFYDGVLCHPICLPPKGHPHTSIFHGATESSEGGSLCQVFLVMGVYRALNLKPDSGGVEHAIAKPFYDGVLCHPICLPPKGRPHTSISHGATEFSEGGFLMPGFLSSDSIARFRGR